jgi:DNA-directed RNA polymerase subunit RPC12/RpoP
MGDQVRCAFCGRRVQVRRPEPDTEYLCGECTEEFRKEV